MTLKNWIFSQGEPQIMDYLTQMYKLFPIMASVYALKFSAQWLWNMYNEVTAKIDAGDLELLPEVSKNILQL